jgi:HEAT repeat protein
LGAARATGTSDELVALRTLLKDQDNTVRLNAASVFTRVKDADSIPVLVEVAKMERVPYPALMLVRALAFQDTPEAWTAVEAIVRQGRAEEMSIAEAALAMGLKQDPRFIESLSVLIASRSWGARRAGAIAMGQIPTDQGAQMLMTFLLEVDPMVRLAVGELARVDVDPVGRRMEWGSINDLSSAVRASDYLALTRSSDPLLRSRGYAGLKEDDIDIRRYIAEGLRGNPQEAHVTPLLGLLSDASPAVRAAAVGSLFAMPGQRNFSEMSVLAGENEDEVLYALLDAARQKKIELPRAMLERLAGHRNPLIRDAVKELGR